MTGLETVVFALLPFRKTGESAVLPQGLKTAVASGNQLMHIALMADVENQFILRRMKDTVNRQGQLHHTQVGRQMAAVPGHGADQLFPDFLRQGIQFLQRQRLQVLR